MLIAPLPYLCTAGGSDDLALGSYSSVPIKGSAARNNCVIAFITLLYKLMSTLKN
jgi:hypothetical protein